LNYIKKSQLEKEKLGLDRIVMVFARDGFEKKQEIYILVLLDMTEERFITLGDNKIRYLEAVESENNLVLVHGLGASANR